MPVNYRNYHPDWKDVIRPQILKRDNYKCKICNVGNRMRIIRGDDDQWLEVDHLIEKEALKTGQKIVKIVLTVAHLNHIVTDNRPENLAALCQLHHIRHDSEHKKAMQDVAKVWNPDLAIKMATAPSGEKYLPHLFVLTRARRNQLAQLITIRHKRSMYSTYSQYDKDLSALIDATMNDYNKLLNATCSILSRAYKIKDARKFMSNYWSSDLKFIGTEAKINSYTDPKNQLN